MSTEDNTNEIKKLFKELNSKCIVYNKVYYKVTKSVAGAVLLSHLMYLHSDVFNSTEFYQTNEQLKRSLGFSDKTLRTAKSAIKKYAIATKKGVPAKNHWVILDDLLIQDIVAMHGSGTSSDAEIGTTGDAEIGTTNNKGITIKNNNKKLHEDDLKVDDGAPQSEPVHNKKEDLQQTKGVEDMAKKKSVYELANEFGIDSNVIDIHISKYGEPSVRLQLKNMATRENIISPAAWLKKALANNYHCGRDKTKATAKSPGQCLAHRPWTEQEYAKEVEEINKLSDPNDWREQLMQASLKEE